MHSWRLIGDILVEDFAVAREQVDVALAQQQESPKRLGELLREQRAIDAILLARALAIQHGLEFIDSIPVESTVDDLLGADSDRLRQKVSYLSPRTYGQSIAGRDLRSHGQPSAQRPEHPDRRFGRILSRDPGRNPARHQPRLRKTGGRDR